MSTKNELLEGLAALGELLARRGLQFDLVVIGGGALLLRDLISRPTQDLDIVATIEAGKWRMASKPLPEQLVEAIREIGEAFDLPREPRDDKDWLNPGPAFLLKLGLPDGFEGRVDIRTFHDLTVHIAARVDLITLKVWAATDSTRGARRHVDIDDLQTLSPTSEELRIAIDWCARQDGRPDFVESEVEPLLAQLGVDLEEIGR